MKIGIVGYQGSGKSTLFEWLTGTVADPALSHKGQTAMATVPDPRVAPLCEIYEPKKVTQAALEIVDTPGLSRTHEGSATRLAIIREAGCLVLLAAAFDGGNPVADLTSFEEDLLIADLDIVSGRIERLAEQVKKPRPNRDELQAELEALGPLHAALEGGKHLRDLQLTPEQQRATRSFQLFSEKPRLAIVNVSDTDPDPARFARQVPAGVAVIPVPLGLEIELSRMPAEERDAFCQEMEIQPFDRDSLLRTLMDASGQMLFFTCGDKEVRTWMIRKGGTAWDAADGIHTDLARGFIRAETFSCSDLFRLGSERELKAHGLVRQEPRDYVIQDGDVITIRHSA